MMFLALPGGWFCSSLPRSCFFAQPSERIPDVELCVHCRDCVAAVKKNKENTIASYHTIMYSGRRGSQVKSAEWRYDFAYACVHVYIYTIYILLLRVERPMRVCVLCRLTIEQVIKIKNNMYIYLLWWRASYNNLITSYACCVRCFVRSYYYNVLSAIVMIL